MKKILMITGSIIALIAIIISCNFLYSNYRTATANAGTYESETETLRKDIETLTQQATDHEDYIEGQQEYIEELTQKLADLESLTSSQDDAKSTDSTEYSESSDSDYEDTDNNYDRYPDLYAQKEYEKKHNLPQGEDADESQEEKVVYLTFDDGPSSLTPQVLDLLDKYNAKATFFVVYKPEYEEYLKEVVDRGHTLALHSYSHDYDKIYASVDAFLTDFQKVYDWVYENTGLRATLFRFPGGSMNGKKAITDEIVAEMERRGFIYYDWNVSSGDGSTLTTSDNIIDNICSNVKYFETPIVLMHDGSGKNATLRALPTVLQNLQDKNYSFEVIPENMEPIQYIR